MTSRALFLSGAPGDTRRYRAFHPAESLELAGWDVRMVALEAQGAWEPDDVREDETLILHRAAWSPIVERAVSLARQRGGIALFDTDDLIFAPEAEERFVALRAIDAGSGPVSINSVPIDIEALGFAEPERYRETLLGCDGCLAAAAPIAEAATELGSRAEVVANALDLELLRLSTRARAAAARAPSVDDTIVIGYASGTATHDRDLEVALPALMALLKRDPRIVLRLMGHVPDLAERPDSTGTEWSQFGERVEHVPYMAWRRLPSALAGLDITIAPLESDDAFALAKSELKFIEAGAVGVPIVATPTPAFSTAIQHGVNGWLAATESEWHEMLGALVESEDLRRRTGEAARAAVLDGWVTDVRSPHLIRAIDRLRAPAEPEQKLPERSEHHIVINGAPKSTEPEMERVVEALSSSGSVDAQGHNINLALGTRAAMSGPADIILLDDEPTSGRHAMGAEWLLARRVLSGLAHHPLAIEDESLQPATRQKIAGLDPWIGPWLEQTFGATSLPCLPYPLDTTIFRPGIGAAERQPIVALQLQAAHFMPNSALGLRTIDRIGVLSEGCERIVFSDRPLEATDALAVALQRMGAVWAGQLDDQARAELLRRAAAIIVPTFAVPPPVMIEAMASGCAVVAPDVAPSRWLLIDGQTAVTAPPRQDTLAHAAATVLRDAVLRERVADGALAMVERMSIGRAATALESIISRQTRASGAVGSDSLERGSAMSNSLILDRLQGLADEHRGPSLFEGETIGQSFMTRFDGLCRLDVRVRGAANAHGRLRLTLRTHAAASEPVTIADRPGPLAADQWLSITFEPLANSAGHSYHAELSWEPDNAASSLEPPEIQTISIDTFADGRATRNRLVDPSFTLVFRTFCRPPAPAPIVGGPAHDRPLADALYLAEQHEISVQRQVQLLESGWPYRLSAWLSLRPPPLPPLDRRPWPADASLPNKTLGYAQALWPHVPG